MKGTPNFNWVGLGAAVGTLAALALALGQADKHRKANAGQSTEVSLYLLWEPQAQFLGYYVAQDKGFFGDQGLSVTIRHDVGAGESFRMLLEREHSFAINQFTNFLEWAGRTDELTPLSVISRGCNIGWLTVSAAGKGRDAGPAQLDELLATAPLVSWWGPSDPLLRNFVASRGLKPRPLVGRVGTRLPRAVPGEYGFLAMSYNERLDFDGVEGKRFVSYCDLGMPIFEDTLIARRPRDPAEAELQSRLREAVWMGWDWTMRYPREALDLLMARGPRKPRDFQERPLRIFLESLARAESDVKHRDGVARTVRQMAENAVFESEASARKLQSIAERIARANSTREVRFHE